MKKIAITVNLTVFQIALLIGYNVVKSYFSEMPKFDQFVYLGISTFAVYLPYLFTTFRFVPKKHAQLIECNFPWDIASELKPANDISQVLEKGLPIVIRLEDIPDDTTAVWVSDRTLALKWESGFHFMWIPISPLMHKREDFLIAEEKLILDIGEELGLGSSKLIEFKDEATGVRIQIVRKVVNIFQAFYTIDDFHETSINRVESVFRRHMAGLTLDKALTDMDARDNATQMTFKEANNALKRWGLRLIAPSVSWILKDDLGKPLLTAGGRPRTKSGKSIAILAFLLSEETKAQRARIMEATKTADVARIEAKGVKDSEITKAEGDQIAEITRAEGTRQATALIEKGVGEGEVAKVQEIATKLDLEPVQVYTFLLTGKLMQSLDDATIIATSEGGGLNAPVNIGATIAAMQGALVPPNKGDV